MMEKFELVQYWYIDEDGFDDLFVELKKKLGIYVVYMVGGNKVEIVLMILELGQGRVRVCFLIDRF